MTMQGKTFRDANIVLDGASFEDCRFINCVLVYSGGPPPMLRNCVFSGEEFRFEGAAANTLVLLQAFATPGSGFEKIVRGSFPDLFGRS